MHNEVSSLSISPSIPLSLYRYISLSLSRSFARSSDLFRAAHWQQTNIDSSHTQTHNCLTSKTMYADLSCKKIIKTEVYWGLNSWDIPYLHAWISNRSMPKTPMTYAKSTQWPTAYWLHSMINVPMFCFYWQHLFFVRQRKWKKRKKKEPTTCTGKKFKTKLICAIGLKQAQKRRQKKNKQQTQFVFFFRNFSSDILYNTSRKFCAQIKWQFLFSLLDWQLFVLI